MADFDDGDFDIDELLDEMDAAGAQPKGKSSTATGASADASGGDVTAAKKSSGGSTKKVHFPDSASADAEDEFNPKTSRTPSSALRNTFSADSSSIQGAGNSKPPLPPTSSASRARTSSSAASASWLGIQQEGMASRSPSNSPPPTQRGRSQFSAAPSATDRKESGNSSDEEDALFRDLNIQTGRKSSSKPPTPQHSANSSGPPSTRPASGGTIAPQPQQQKYRFGASQDSTPPLSLGAGDSPKLPPKSTFSSSILDQLGKSPSTSPRGSMDLGKGKPLSGLAIKANPPLPSVASLLGTGLPSSAAPQPPLPVDPVPTFPPKMPQSDPFASFSLAAPAVVPEPPPPQTATTTTKKKVVRKDIGGGGGVSSVASTLQLPMHLVNEEELKAMSASLKTLYTNQLDQLQNSYKDQLSFLSEANRRKEELHKEEMNAMQREYEERLERLRNEVRQLESRQTLKTQLPPEEMATITALSEQLNSSITSLQQVLSKSRESSADVDNNTVIAVQDVLRSVLREHHERNQTKMEGIEEKVCTAVKTVDESVARRFSLMNDAWRNLVSQVKQNMMEVMEAAKATSAGSMSAAELRKLEEVMSIKLEKMMGLVEKLERGNANSGVQLITKMEDSEKTVISELLKVQKLQRKAIREDGLSMEPLVKILESDREEDQRKREKLAVQIKEMRRDLKRILIESESRQETNQKFNYVTESELKSISQSIRDFNSQLKFNLMTAPSQSDNLASQFNANMQQTQAEMEMKMLREERSALSESMAQINVEKRKLSEEKIHLEKQKLDFEKERDRVRNLEAQLRTKLEETEELQKKTESVRREELQLSTEAQLKLKEMDKEKFLLKGKLMEAEQRFLVCEQKLRADKMEQDRERDFLEKLRDQLLCPGCLKPNEAAAGVVVHPPPPPYIPLDTTTLFNRQNNSVSNFANDYLSAADGDEMYDVIRRKYF